MRILIIEDDVSFMKNLKRALELEGHEVDTAYDGVVGLKKAIRNMNDAIILDLMLPKKDGLQVCRELRDAKIATPIIMLTARGLLDDRVMGLDSGADDYLIKPFGFEELSARLRSLFRRRKTILEPAILKIADIIFNPAIHEITRNGKTLPLAPKEYKLLYYFLRNQRRVIPREELIAYLWKSKPKGNDLDVHIRYLRKKIDNGRKEKLIRTVKSVGFQIRD